MKRRAAGLGPGQATAIAQFVAETVAHNQARRRATTIVVRVSADGVLQLFEAIPAAIPRPPDS